MFKLHVLAGWRQCSPIFHPHIRKLTTLVENNAPLCLGNVSSRGNEPQEISVHRRKPRTTCRRLQKYSVNETCYVRRNFSSDVKEPSFNISTAKNFSFDLNLRENRKNKSHSKLETSGFSKRKEETSSRNDALLENTAVSMDKSFLQDLLREYDTQKSVMFKEAPASTPASLGVAEDSATHNDSTGSLTEREAVDDADVFGTMGGVLKDVPVFEEDEKDEERLTVIPPINMRERQEEYVHKIQALCKEGNLPGAIAVLEEMREEKVTPVPYHFRLLIGACAKMGLVEDAFRLFAQLKGRGHVPKPLLYSYLFIACYNARDPGQHVQRITELRAKMAELQIELSVMNYNAMLLAFGRCGAVETAFEVFDEMRLVSKYLALTRSFNCLMTACISDREVGFRYAIELWQKMGAMKIKPDIYSFNLLLRSVVECKSGDPDLLLELFTKMSKSSSLLGDVQNTSNNFMKITAKSLPRKSGVVDVSGTERDVPSSHVDGKKVYFHGLTASDESGASFNKHGDQKERNSSNVRPTTVEDCLLSSDEGEGSSSAQLGNEIRGKSDAPNYQFFDSLESDASTNGIFTGPSDERVVEQTRGVHSVHTNSAAEDPGTSLLNADEPPQRLMLLGGLTGVLNSMAAQRVRPTMKTFLTLLWALPDTLRCEEELLRAMKDVNITPTTTFCNMLIKKRALRGDYALTKSTLSLLSEHRLNPDIITYGCLALGCHSFSDAMGLIKSITQQGGCPNLIIMLNLARNAVASRQYNYCTKLFDQLQKHRIESNAMMVELMEEARTQAIADLKKLENGDSAKRGPEIRERKLFLQRYHKWLRKTPSPPQKKAEDKKNLRADVASNLL